jgi:hypothetical protein
MIKDYRFVPLEKHEPVEEEDDFNEELVLTEYHKRALAKQRSQLYIAS